MNITYGRRRVHDHMHCSEEWLPLTAPLLESKHCAIVPDGGGVPELTTTAVLSSFERLDTLSLKVNVGYRRTRATSPLRDHAEIVAR